MQIEDDVQSLCSEASFHSAYSDDDFEAADADRYFNEKPSINLMDFIAQQDFSEVISTPASVTPGEAMVMLLKYSLKHELSFSGISELFRMVNNFFAKPILPESKYMLDKILNPTNDVEFHAVCPSCCKNLGEFHDIGSERKIRCNVCNFTVDVSNPSSPSFFAIINPSEQIFQYLRQHEDYYDFVVNERPYKEDEISDIYDGSKYREFVASLRESEKRTYVTLNINTDGVPTFKSSKYSIWPIYLQINELPVQDRFKSLITCGVWFGKTQPEMNAFLSPLVNKLNKLSENGIDIKIKGEQRIIKPYVLVGIFDAPARCKATGTSQFNGKYGCDWCLNPTSWDTATRYTKALPIPIERSKQKMLDWCEEATEKRTPVFGVKHATPLYYLRNFCIVWSIVPDYMHACLLGVGKQFTTFFINSLTRDQFENLDDLMIRMKIPNQAARLPRSLTEKEFWKAKEWENFILFFSIPLFDTVFDRATIKHWSLFVQGLYILLKQIITKRELEKANKYLHEFVSKTQDLYGTHVMTYNVHQLLHICDSVKHWGPLWSINQFPFENKNGVILSSINGAKGVILQILRNINMQHSYALIENTVFKNCSQQMKHYLENFLIKRTKNCQKVDNLSYYGTRKYCLDPHFLARYNLSFNSVIYTRIIKDRCLYTTNHRENSKSCNYYAQLKDLSFIKIINFVYDPNASRNYVICDKLITTTSIYNQFMHRIHPLDENPIIINTSELNRVCVYIEIENDSFVCPLPNLYSYN